MNDGCKNRPPFRAAYAVQDGWRYFRDGLGGMTRQPKIVMQPHVLTTDCRYSVETRDQACEGCKWKA